MQIERLTTTNNRGEKLTAAVDLPVDGEPIGFALLVHCLAGIENSRAAVNLSGGLTARGIGVVRFDFTGQESRQKEENGLSTSAATDDLLALTNFMQRELAPPMLLIGHSLGGALILQAAGQIPTAKALATIGAPFGSDGLARLADDSERSARVGGPRFSLSKAFLHQLLDAESEAASLDAALMILHSPTDELVGFEHAVELFQAARHPKSLVSLEDADHLLTDASPSRRAGDILAAWAGKYIDAGQQEAKYIRPDDNRVFTHTGAAGYYTQIMANGHPLVADEPKAVGGTDAGPSPYDLVTAALGACTGMTLRMYADRKEWPLKGVSVRLRHAKVHAHDCETCEAEKGNIDHIERAIALDGPLSEQQRERLIEIANRCPVHQTLVDHVTIDTTESAAP